jgi:hypothetical protein
MQEEVVTEKSQGKENEEQGYEERRRYVVC